MNRTDIIERVKEYIKDDNAKYAILIDGSWGCGKTYLYRNYLLEEIKKLENGKTNKKHNVYISLYGVSSISELSRELLLKFISVKSSKGTGKNEDLVFKTAGVLGLISNCVSFNVKGVSVGGLDKAYEQALELIKSKKMVICLDDFERCAIPINEIFGWINNLTEHCECKVIILADESNIGKMYANVNLETKYLSILGGRRVVDKKEEKEVSYPNRTMVVADGKTTEKYEEISLDELKQLNEKIFSENYLYKDIKEKVIGEVLYYLPVTKDTIKDILNGFHDENHVQTRYEKYLESVSDIMVAQFEKATKGVNYRTVLFWIKKYERIYSECKKLYADNKYYDDMLTELLKYSIAKTCEYKQGISIKHISGEKYSFVQYSDYGERIHTYVFIDKWIEASSWRDKWFKDECTEAIDRFAYEDEKESKKRPVSTGMKLVEIPDWRYKNDDQVWKDIKDLITELKNGKYVFYDFPRILGDIIYLDRQGFHEDGLLDELKDIMIEQINLTDGLCEESPIPVIFDSEDDKKRFEKIYPSISEYAKNHNLKYKKEEAVSSNVFSDADEFAKYCSEKYDAFYANRSFIGFVGVDELLNLIKISDLEGKYKIAEAISQVYRVSNIKEFLTEDLPLLKDVTKALMDENIFSDGITDTFCKNYMVDNLGRIIAKLE